MTRRLLFSYVGLALLVLAGLEIPLGYLYARGEESRFAQTIERDATMLAEVTEENIEKGNLTELPTIIGDYTARTGGRVVVTDRTGLVLAASGSATPADTDLSAQPDIAAALRNQPTTGTSTDAYGAAVLYATQPGASGTTIRGALRLTYPSAMVTDRVHRIWIALTLAGACILAAVGLVAFTLARWITRPLRTLEHATRQLAVGHLANPPDATTGPPELRSLAASFTRTATRLQHLLDAQHAFASEASHQLKTPLTALRLRLENFEPYLDPRAHSSLDETIEEVERLARMVHGLLALARLENSATTPEPVDLDEVVADRATSWEPFAAEQQVTLAVTGPRRARCRRSRAHWNRSSTTCSPTRFGSPHPAPPSLSPARPAPNSTSSTKAPVCHRRNGSAPSTGSGAPPPPTTTAPAWACPLSATSSAPPAVRSPCTPPRVAAWTPISGCARPPPRAAAGSPADRTRPGPTAGWMPPAARPWPSEENAAAVSELSPRARRRRPWWPCRWPRSRSPRAARRPCPEPRPSRHPPCRHWPPRT